MNPFFFCRYLQARRALSTEQFCRFSLWNENSFFRKMFFLPRQWYRWQQDIFAMHNACIEYWLWPIQPSFSIFLCIWIWKCNTFIPDASFNSPSFTMYSELSVSFSCIINWVFKTLSIFNSPKSSKLGVYKNESFVIGLLVGRLDAINTW